MQHYSVTSFAEPPKLHPKNPDLYTSSNPLTWRKAKENTKKMGRTSHFAFSRKSALPQTTNTHLIAEKPPPGQRPVTLSKAERILGTAGHINVDGGAGGRMGGGQGVPWNDYRMTGGAERQHTHRTQRSQSEPHSHGDGGDYASTRQSGYAEDMDHMEEVMKSRNRLEDDAYHDNLRTDRSNSTHTDDHSHQSPHHQWQNDDLGDLLPPRKHGLAARASSTLLGSSFKNDREGGRDLRQEKSSSTLRSHYDHSKVPPSTSNSHGRPSQLRKMESPVPEHPRSPHHDMNHHDVETLAAAEMRAATLRDQMRREGRKPEKKTSRLNIGRLFGGKEKKKKDQLEGFVMQDPRHMQHHRQRTESLDQVLSVDMSRLPSNGPSRNHAGVHDLYENYETQAFRTEPLISEEQNEYQRRDDHFVDYRDAPPDHREGEVSPKSNRNALHSHPITHPHSSFSTQKRSQFNEPPAGDLHAFKFPAPTDPLATARHSKPKMKKPIITSIFPAPYVPPNTASHELNLHSGLGSYPTQSQMRRLSGTPPSAPPNVAPPPPPVMRRTGSDSGPSANGRGGEELQKGYAQRHWDNGSTHSSATGMSKSSKKSIFSSSNLAQNSVLSFSSDSDSDVEARFEDEKRRIRELEGRPKTSDENDRKDINGQSGRSKDHQRKRSSTISTPASQFSQDDKYLTIPLPSPTSNRLSGPWQLPTLTPREKERDSGSTLRGGMSHVDKRMSSSTTASGVSMLSISSAQSGMSGKSMHSNGNGRLSSHTLSSVAESSVYDSDYSMPMPMLDPTALPSPRMPPPLGPIPPRPKRSDSTSSQSKNGKSPRSATPSTETLRDTSGNRPESKKEGRSESRSGSRSDSRSEGRSLSRSESRSERKKSTPDASRAPGNLMHVTPQELALLSALRSKRAKMRDEILAEAEAREEEEIGELNIKMRGFEFPAPPSEGRPASTTTDSTITSIGALAHSRHRDSSDSQFPNQRTASRTDSMRQRHKKHRVSEAPSRAELTRDALYSSRRESIITGHSLSPAPQRREHMPQRQGSLQSKLSNHERAESDTLDGVEVPSSNSASSSQFLTPNVRHPKADDETRENAMNERLVMPLNQHTKTSTESAAPSPEHSDFLSFDSDGDTPRSSWNPRQKEVEEKTGGEQERRRMARLSEFGPQKIWDVPLQGGEAIAEDESFDDSEGEAILREWGR